MEVLNASKKSHFIINGILFDITIFLVIMSAFICLSPTLGLPEAFLSRPPFTVIFTSVFGNIDFTTGPQILSHGATSTRNSMYIQTTSVSGGSWQKHHVSTGRVGSVPFSYILPRWGRESPVGEPVTYVMQQNYNPRFSLLLPLFTNVEGSLFLPQIYGISPWPPSPVHPKLLSGEPQESAMLWLQKTDL